MESVPLTRPAVLAAVFSCLIVAAGPAASVLHDPADSYIQPGDQLNGNCTLNFVFNGTGSKAGTYYIGTAAHCVSSGQSASTPGFSNFGTVVFDDDATTDFALIEVDDSDASSLRADLKGHPGVPTGVTASSDTTVGDLLILSGYGMGFDETTATRENRTGVLVSDSTTTYRADTLLVFGDSGGPLVHEPTGMALGSVSAFNFVDIPPTTDVGPTIDWAIDEMAAAGLTVSLRKA